MANIRKVKIIISGAYGNRNLGDELILVSLLKMIKEYIPNSEIMIFSFNPLHTMEYYKVSSYSQWPEFLKINYFKVFWKPIFWKHLYQIVKIIKNCDIFLLGGGGLFEHEYPGVFFWTSKVLIAQLFKKPTIIYAVGVEPIWNKKILSKLLLKFIFRKARVILVRDRISKENLLKLGIPFNKIGIVGDPVFFLRSEFLRYKRANHRTACLSICFSIRPIQYPWRDGTCYLSDRQKQLNRSIAEILDKLIDEFNAHVYLLPMNIEDDRVILENIYKTIQTYQKVTLLEKISLEKLWELFCNFNLVISMRLHPLIIASILKIPFIGIISHPKILKFLVEINQPSLGISYKELDKTLFPYDKIKYVLLNYHILYAEKINSSIQNLCWSTLQLSKESLQTVIPKQLKILY